MSFPLIMYSMCIGQHLESHCSVSPEDGTCVYCEENRTYNSDPNSLDSCEPCTSCDSKGRPTHTTGRTDTL